MPVIASYPLSQLPGAPLPLGVAVAPSPAAFAGALELVRGDGLASNQNGFLSPEPIRPYGSGYADLPTPLLAVVHLSAAPAPPLGEPASTAPGLNDATISVADAAPPITTPEPGTPGGAPDGTDAPSAQSDASPEAPCEMAERDPKQRVPLAAKRVSPPMESRHAETAPAASPPTAAAPAQPPTRPTTPDVVAATAGDPKPVQGMRADAPSRPGRAGATSPRRPVAAERPATDSVTQQDLPLLPSTLSPPPQTAASGTGAARTDDAPAETRAPTAPGRAPVAIVDRPAGDAGVVTPSSDTLARHDTPGFGDAVGAHLQESPPGATREVATRVAAQPGRIGTEMGVAIARHAVAGQPETITVRLDPKDMGRIEVRLAFDDAGTLRAVVSADTSAALEMLRRDAGDLGRALADAGVRADGQSLRFDTRTSGGNDPGQRHHGGDPRHTPSPPPSSRQRHADGEYPVFAETPIYRPLRTSGRVDLTA